LCSTAFSGGPHQAVHDCIRGARWQQQATAQNTLTYSTDFLRHSLATRVSRRAHNLESNQIGCPKRVLGYKASGSRCYPSPHRGRSNPVAQIRKSVRRADLIDPATPKEATAFTEDRKLVGHALFGKLLLDGHPLSSFVERVTPVAPRHPGVDLGHRLQGGCVHFLCVPLLIQTDGVSTHVVASGSVERAGQAPARVRTRASAVSVPRVVSSSRLFASLFTLNNLCSTTTSTC